MQKWLTDQKSHVDNLYRALPDAGSILGHAEQRLDDMWERVTLSGRTVITTMQHCLQTLALQLKSPHAIVEKMQQSLGSYSERLDLCHGQNMTRFAGQLDTLSALLESYSYRNVLQRGFSVVRDDNGQVIQSAQNVQSETTATVEFYDGTRGVIFSGGDTNPKKSPAKQTGKTHKYKTDQQGDLF